MGEKYPFLAYLGHIQTWTRAMEVGAVAFFALVGFREAERWFNPACPPATWQGALVFGVTAALLDLLDRYGSRQKRESGRFPPLGVGAVLRGRPGRLRSYRGGPGPGRYVGLGGPADQHSPGQTIGKQKGEGTPSPFPFLAAIIEPAPPLGSAKAPSRQRRAGRGAFFQNAPPGRGRSLTPAAAPGSPQNSPPGR